MNETCPTCGLTYLPELAEDQRAHRKCCRRWTSATIRLGYSPRLYAEREELKHQGHQDLVMATTPGARLAAAEKIIRGRFDRSLDAAITGGYWRQHPRFERFAAMVEWDDLPPDVQQLVRSRYGRIEGAIPPGKSYWLPRTSGPTKPQRTIRQAKGKR